MTTSNISQVQTKMPTVNTLFDTPVRRHEEPVTTSNLFLRFNRPKNKSLVDKLSKNIGEKQDISKAGLPLPIKIITPVPLENESMDLKCDLKTDNDVSVIEVDETNATVLTTCEDMSSSKIDVDGEILISKQKHSTPRDVKIQAKAVSSTPNQETFNISRLRRSVASQTNLTLNARNLNEFDEDIKSYIIDVPEEKSEPVVKASHTSHFNEGTHCHISPLRPLYISKLTNCNSPVENKMMNVRKLSLRSKTMISSAIEKSKDIFPRYKSLEEKRLISNTFSLLPHPKTPPSCSEKVIHNPFEADLSERLGKSIFSPNVFDNVVSPSEDSEYLRWTIEDISSINPVHIEEDFTLPSDDEDPEKESQVQEEIERYFSETHLVLSPNELLQKSNNSPSKKVKHHMRAAASTPQKEEIIISKELKNVNIQTALTLPEILPDEVDNSLKSFFQLFETDEFNCSASHLRRKLFFHCEDEPPSPVRFENHSSPLTKESWELEQSPYSVAKRGRHFTPLANQGAFSSPEMSPVLDDSTNVKLENKLLSTCKKTLHLYFTGNVLRSKEEKDCLVENSTVIMRSVDSQRDMAVDSDSNSALSSALPSSQDTGYHTEESWQHCHPFSMMASTPTQPAQ